MLSTLRGEGVAFDDQLIDRTFPHDNAPTRKPGTGMFGRYTGGEYDLAASYVIGDRVTDILLARNLGARGILLAPAAEGLRMLDEAGAADACALVTDSWAEIAEFIRRGERRVEVRRETRETQITVRLDLDGRGDFNGEISTGLRFLDHMLAQIAHHGGVSLAVDARGDLDIDEHHTMEDVAITLGEAIDRALGTKAGIARYGFALPMDDCRALVLLDFGGRIDFEWDAVFRRERVGDVPTEMFRHFFHSLACAARCNLQISARGDNDHHKAEAIFKAFARALRMAVGRAGLRIRHSQQQRSPMIAVVDYDTGNLRSVADALHRAGAEFILTADPALLRRADRVILPGVGEASSAMAKLRERGLDTVIPTLTQPVLGICIGMQLMCLSSEEGDARCMGIFPTRFRRLPDAHRRGRAAQSPPRGLGHDLGAPHPAVRRHGRRHLCVLRPLLRGGTVPRRPSPRPAYGVPFSAALGTRQLLRHAVPPRKERGGRAR